jgi:nucleoid-associated protein YgaU
MRRARASVILVLLLAGGAAGLYYGMRNVWQPPTVPGAGAPAGSREAQAPGSEDPARPTFDIVRAEPGGEMIMAGRAQPGWSVTVESDGKVIGSAVADDNGEWVIQPGTPLAAGEHSLQLKAQPKTGGRTLFSKQRLALSLGQAGKNRPVVALTEEGQATRVLQRATQPGEPPVTQAGAAGQLQTPPFKPALAESSAPSPEVTFSAMDYEMNGNQGKVHIAGRANPGARVLLFIDDQFLGAATADATGAWSFSGARLLPPGSHIVRADTVDASSGQVLARAEVTFDPEGPVAATAGAVAGAAQPSLAAGPRGPGAAQPQRSAAATTEAGAPVIPPPGATTITINDLNGAPKVIIVRRGDTLWQIAQQHYGSGLKYTQIFQNNRDQIRNPNRIYPSQRFAIPQ